MKKLILFELNEVPIKILDYFIKVRPNSWLAKNYNRLRKFETFVENQGHLSPWNTWPTLHRGVPSQKHFIADFNQDLREVDEAFPPLWKILSKQNLKVGVFGSLHSYPLPENVKDFAFYVPDIFSPNYDTFPKSIEAYQKFNLNLSRRSPRNVDTSLPLKDTFKFVANAGSLGVRLKTFRQLSNQLIEERINDWKKVRRRTYQSVIAFDIFFKQLKSKKPDFVTFFTNHVASSMHRYWAASFPSEYEKMSYDDEWIRTYDSEICFAMERTDEMLQRLGQFVDANPEFQLMIASSMGQEAVESEPYETLLYVKDAQRFLSVLGIEKGSFEIFPAMIPQFNFKLSEEKKKELEENLKALKVNGEGMTYRVKDEGFYSLDFGHKNLKEIQISLHDKSYSLEESGLTNMVIDDKSGATAYHIPQGHLFSYHISNLENKDIESQLYCCDIPVMILNNFGLKSMPYMNKSKLSI